jgi:hypothetical protein
VEVDLKNHSKEIQREVYAMFWMGYFASPDGSPERAAYAEKLSQLKEAYGLSGLEHTAIISLCNTNRIAISALLDSALKAA